MKKGVTEEMKQEMIRMSKAGKTLREIGEHFSLAGTTVSYHLKKTKIKKPKKPKRPIYTDIALANSEAAKFAPNSRKILFMLADISQLKDILSEVSHANS